MDPFRTPPESRNARKKEEIAFRYKNIGRKKREDTPILPRPSVLAPTPPRVDTPPEKKKKPSFPTTNDFLSPFAPTKNIEKKKKKKKRKKKKSMLPGSVKLVESRREPAFPVSFGGTPTDPDSFFDQLSNTDEILDFTKKEKTFTLDKPKMESEELNIEEDAIPSWKYTKPQLLSSQHETNKEVVKERVEEKVVKNEPSSRPNNFFTPNDDNQAPRFNSSPIFNAESSQPPPFFEVPQNMNKPVVERRDVKPEVFGQRVERRIENTRHDPSLFRTPPPVNMQATKYYPPIPSQIPIENKRKISPPRIRNDIFQPLSQQPEKNENETNFEAVEIGEKKITPMFSKQNNSTPSFPKSFGNDDPFSSLFNSPHIPPAKQKLQQQQPNSKNELFPPMKKKVAVIPMFNRPPQQEEEKKKVAVMPMFNRPISDDLEEKQIPRSYPRYEVNKARQPSSPFAPQRISNSSSSSYNSPKLNIEQQQQPRGKIQMRVEDREKEAMAFLTNEFGMKTSQDHQRYNLSPNDSPVSTPPKARMPMPSNTSFQTNGPPTLRPLSSLYDFQRQACPCVALGFGGRVATVFPQKKNLGHRHDPNFMMMNNSLGPYTQNSNVVVTPLLSHCRFADPQEAVNSSQHYEDSLIDSFYRYPGPLSSKSNLSDLIRFLNTDMMVKECQRASPNTSLITDPSYGDGLRFIEILRSLAKFHDTPLDKLVETISLILTVGGRDLISDTTFSKFANEEATNSSVESDYKIQLEPVSVTVDHLNKLKILMLSGKIELAIDLAVENRMWSHALFLSSMVSREKYQVTVRKYIHGSFFRGTPLHTLYSVFCGFGCDVFDRKNLYFSKSTSERQKEQAKNRLIRDQLFENVAGVLCNAVDGRSKYLLNLAAEVKGRSSKYRVASDIIHFVTSVFCELGKDEVGQVREAFALLGSESGRVLRPRHVRYTEVVFYIKTMMALKTGMPYVRDLRFDRYLVIYLIWLLELGFMRKADVLLRTLEARVEELSRIYIGRCRVFEGNREKVPPFLQLIDRDLKEIRARMEYVVPLHDKGGQKQQGDGFLGSRFGFIRSGLSGIMGLVSSTNDDSNNSGSSNNEREENNRSIPNFGIDTEGDDEEQQGPVTSPQQDLQFHARGDRNDSYENIDSHSLWHTRNY